jgi:hypothetical protein
MKSLYDKITDEYARMLEEQERDKAIEFQLREACRPTKDGKWKVSDDGMIELPCGAACSYRVRAGRIQVSSPNRQKILGEFDGADIDGATNCIAAAMAKVLKADEAQQAEQLRTQGWRRPSSPPLYPA